MAGKTRVPKEISLFNAYINNTADYLEADSGGGPQKNWERLGLTATNMGDWKQQRKYWAETLYLKYSNVNTRTKTVTQEVQGFKKDFAQFAQPLLTIMAASPNVTDDDAGVLNFVINRKKPTHTHTPITEACFAKYTALGGGEMKASYSSATDSKRASLLKGANCIQVSYKVGDTPPVNVHDGTKTDIVPRATYVLDLGSENSGKKLFIYQRWYNSKYPELAGPWSALQTVLIT